MNLCPNLFLSLHTASLTLTVWKSGQTVTLLELPTMCTDMRIPPPTRCVFCATTPLLRARSHHPRLTILFARWGGGGGGRRGGGGGGGAGGGGGGGGGGGPPNSVDPTK
jgi:uncharacterized membrane protein YgcG